MLQKSIHNAHRCTARHQPIAQSDISSSNSCDSQKIFIWQVASEVTYLMKYRYVTFHHRLPAHLSIDTLNMTPYRYFTETLKQSLHYQNVVNPYVTMGNRLTSKQKQVNGNAVLRFLCPIQIAKRLCFISSYYKQLEGSSKTLHE